MVNRSDFPSGQSLRLRCEVILASLAEWIISAWWAPRGIAAIPTSALDPPHCAASPAVPALLRVRVPTAARPKSTELLGSGGQGLRLRDLFELRQKLGMIHLEIPRDACIGDELGDVATRENQIEVITAVCVLDQAQLAF